MIDAFAELDITLPTYAPTYQSSPVSLVIDYVTLMSSVSLNASAFHKQEDILAFFATYGTVGTNAFTIFESDTDSSYVEITSDTTKWRSKKMHGTTNTYGTIFQYLGTKKFCKITITPSTYSAAAPLVYGLVRGNKRLTQNVA